MISSIENEPIVARIREWCFTQKSERLDDHNLFQDLLVNLLRENGWYAFKEHEFEKYPKLNALTKEINERRGFIDVCAFAHNKKLVIEYDSTTQLRSKSICKLFWSDADFPVGIVRGKRGKPLRFENIAKIRRIGRDYGITGKRIYLIIIENKIAEWLVFEEQLKPKEA